MLSKILMASVFGLGLATPALANANDCYEPIPPAAVNGNTATEAQMQAALKDVKEFLRASDDYQTCLLSDLAEQKRKAERSKDKAPLDPSIEADVRARVQKNQALKEKVGGEYNSAAEAFNAAHPKQ